MYEQKKHRPNESGRVVKVQEAEGGIDTDVAIVNTKHDSALVGSSIEAHKKRFGCAPTSSPPIVVLFGKERFPRDRVWCSSGRDS